MLARRTLYHTLATVGILAAYATSIPAGEKAGSTRKRLTASQCERLVKQLVYPGKPPFKEEYVFPEKINENAILAKQRKVKAAYDKLSDSIETALPILVKHADDDRLSYVYEDVGTSGVITKAPVGFACYLIVEAHVEVYRRHVERPDFASIPRCPAFINDACGGIDKWWKTRKEKTLAELQLEGIEWALRLEKPKLFKSNEEWAKAKKALKKMAEGIRASKRPILVKHHVNFFGK
jgi:hypothetical protein